jgi:hypothetical protein
MDPVLSRFILLQNKDTEGYLVVAYDATVREVFASTVGAMLGEGDPVGIPIAILHECPNVGVCLVRNRHGEAALREASYGLLVTLRSG